MKNLAFVGLVVGLGGLAACGKIVGAGQPDAAKVFDDAHADAQPDANLTGSVRFVTQTHVTGSGVLEAIQPGTVVFSTRPNNTMVDMQTSDAGGSGSLMIYPGGSVTAVYPHMFDNGGGAGIQGADLVTFVGVKDSDTLTFGTRYSADTGSRAIVGNVTVSTGFAQAFVEGYGPCGFFNFTAPAQTIPIYNWCDVRPAAFEVSILIEEETPTCCPETIGYTTTNLSGASPSITGVVGAPNNAARSITTSATGLPAEITSVNFNLTNTLNPSILVNSGNSGFNNASASGNPTGGALTETLMPAVNGDHMLATLSMTRPGNYSSTALYDQLAQSATSWTVSTPALPPYLNGSTFFSDRNEAVWNVDAPADAMTFDGTVVLLNWTHQMVVSGTTTNVPYTWTFIVPPTQMELTLPTLPSQFTTYAPQPAVDNVGLRVRLVEFPSVSGYDALRAVPERNITCPDCAVRTGEMARAIVND